MDDPRHRNELHPVSQSREAFDWLNAFGDAEVEDTVISMGARVREIAPDCVALSLTMMDGDVTFTLAADRPGVALVDAMQYLDGGPCVYAVDHTTIQVTSDLPTDEGRWQLFALAENLVGISSSLSLPVVSEGRTVGGVNLYGGTNDCFDGRHEELAVACGAWAAGAITNADLGFTSRVRAAATADRLHDLTQLEIASGIVAAHQGIDTTLSGQRIRDAASRAGVSPAEFARFILDARADDLE